MEAVKLGVEDVIYYPDVMVACGAEDNDSLVEMLLASWSRERRLRRSP
jgi:hypothetical protein